MFNPWKTYHLFISHSWSYPTHYNTLLNWIDSSKISYKNYSVPCTDPFNTRSAIKLQAAITEQIAHASVVIITAGIYVSYSEWIDYEIQEAVRMGKPILAVKPWGNERLPQTVQDNATRIVNWNSASFISRLKELL